MFFDNMFNFSLNTSVCCKKWGTTTEPSIKVYKKIKENSI